MNWIDNIHIGDARAVMRLMIADGVKVQCIVSSPPYWGLRDYSQRGQYGLERTWVRHLARARGTWRIARELLADTGTLWLNYGDSHYSNRGNGGVGYTSKLNGKRSQEEFRKASRNMKSRIRSPDIEGPNRYYRQPGLKDKDLVMMPSRVAIALQEDGWWLRDDIIWHKSNPMPGSYKDRPTSTYEHLFLLSKKKRYYYDCAAIAEEASPDTHARVAKEAARDAAAGVNPKAQRFRKDVAGWKHGAGTQHTAKDHARVDQGLKDGTKFGRGAGWRNRQNSSMAAAISKVVVPKRNARNVWKMPTDAFKGPHFATFPRELVRRCILAGSKPGDTIFDPFMGTGTTAEVALSLGRHFIGIDLDPRSREMFVRYRNTQQVLL